MPFGRSVYGGFPLEGVPISNETERGDQPWADLTADSLDVSLGSSRHDSTL